MTPCLELHEQTAYVIENRLALVQLHPSGEVGAMSEDTARPGIHGPAREGLDELCRIIGVPVLILPFMGMQADEHKVTAFPCILNAAVDFLLILLMRGCFDTGLLSLFKG